MSVFTPLTAEQVSVWLQRHCLGSLTRLAGIAEGVQNSNFFLDTTQGAFVLTVFEQLALRELPFYVGLMAHLAAHGIPCPAPVADRSGSCLGELCGKPALVVTRLAGRSVSAPDAAQCAAVGAVLADLHLAAASYAGEQPHPRGRAWCTATAERVAPFLNADDAALLRAELRHQAQQRPDDLPRGVIHADLFRDNVLFEGKRVSGLLDFYFAGVDDLLFDVAVTTNDWCILPDGSLDTQRCQALLAAYHARRPFSPGEHAAWPTLLRAAALRFWLSRLEDFHLPRSGTLVNRRDPDDFRAILISRMALPAMALPVASSGQAG